LPTARVGDSKDAGLGSGAQGCAYSSSGISHDRSSGSNHSISSPVGPAQRGQLVVVAVVVDLGDAVIRAVAAEEIIAAERGPQR
jgi:hypothetical protein